MSCNHERPYQSQTICEFLRQDKYFCMLFCHFVQFDKMEFARRLAIQHVAVALNSIVLSITTKLIVSATYRPCSYTQQSGHNLLMII